VAITRGLLRNLLGGALRGLVGQTFDGHTIVSTNHNFEKDGLELTYADGSRAFIPSEYLKDDVEVRTRLQQHIIAASQNVQQRMDQQLLAGQQQQSAMNAGMAQQQAGTNRPKRKRTKKEKLMAAMSDYGYAGTSATDTEYTGTNTTNSDGSYTIRLGNDWGEPAQQWPGKQTFIGNPLAVFGDVAKAKETALEWLDRRIEEVCLPV